MTTSEQNAQEPCSPSFRLERYRFGLNGATELVSDNYPVTIGEMGQHVAVSDPPPLSVTWTISTLMVAAGYTPSPQIGQVLPVTPLMLVQNPLTFAFLIAGEYVVTASIVTVAGTGQVSNTFTFTAPTLLDFGSVTSLPNVGQNPAGATFLQFGNTGNPPTPGIAFTATIRGDQLADGTLAFIQLANNSRFYVSGQFSFHWSTNGLVVLDVGMTASVFYQNTFQAITSGQTVDIDATDSPAQQLPVPPGDTTAFIVGENLENYQVFLMFCSNQPQAIWVPLGLLNWGWGGEALNEAGTWTIASPENTQNPIGAPSNIFPSWTSNTATWGQWIPGA